VTVVPVAVADDVPGRAEDAVRQFGFERAAVDRHDVIADPRVAAVSVAAPNFLHREIGTAVAQAGKRRGGSGVIGDLAEHLRVPGARKDRRPGVGLPPGLGLPPDGGVGRRSWRSSAGPDGQHRLRRTPRGRVRRLPAGRRHRDELRRPQGDRVGHVPAVDRGASTVRSTARGRRSVARSCSMRWRDPRPRVPGCMSTPVDHLTAVGAAIVRGDPETRRPGDPETRRPGGLDAPCSPCHIFKCQFVRTKSVAPMGGTKTLPHGPGRQQYRVSPLRGLLLGAPMDRSGPPLFQPGGPQTRGSHEERITR
jgi:hypothetical protein